MDVLQARSKMCEYRYREVSKVRLSSSHWSAADHAEHRHRGAHRQARNAMVMVSHLSVCLQLINQVLVKEKKQLLAAERLYLQTEDTVREQVCLAEHRCTQGPPSGPTGLTDTLQVPPYVMFMSCLPNLHMHCTAICYYIQRHSQVLGIPSPREPGLKPTMQAWMIGH